MSDTHPVGQACNVIRLGRELAEGLALTLLEFSADQPWESWGAENLLDDRPCKWDLSFIATSGGQPLGYAIISAPDAATHHLHRIAVSSTMRSHGVGQALMRAALKQAEDRSASLTLKVHASNQSAVRFYQKLGFVTVSATAEQIVMSWTRP